MPTEAQFMAWISINWPSVALGVLSAIIYVAAYLRLQQFLARVDKLETLISNLSKEANHLRAKVGKLVRCHCRKYPDEMEALLKDDEEDKQ